MLLNTICHSDDRLSFSFVSSRCVILSVSEGSEERKWMHIGGCTQILHFVQNDKVEEILTN